MAMEIAKTELLVISLCDIKIIVYLEGKSS